MDNKYSIDDLLGDSPVSRAMQEPVPDFVESGEGVSPAAVGSGGLEGNLVMQDGYMQSSNFVSGVSGWQITPTSAEFNVGVSVDELHIPDEVTANSFHTDNDGNSWWGATVTDFVSDIANAAAYILKDGTALFKSVTLQDNVEISGIANSAVTDIQLLEATHNLTFSVTNADTVAWSSGVIEMSNGRTFSISAGDTGSMAALTYIYLDPDISITVLQTTTAYSTAIGANKRLIGVAQNNTVGASFVPYGAGQLLVDGEQINASSIVASNIAASAITASKISVADLSAISADMGAITAGTITLNSSGHIKGGQTAYNTGTGFFLGYSGVTHKLSLGSPTGSFLNWDGFELRLRGSFDVGTNGIINNSVYTVATLPAQPTTVGFNPPSATSDY